MIYTFSGPLNSKITFLANGLCVYLCVCMCVCVCVWTCKEVMKNFHILFYWLQAKFWLYLSNYTFKFIDLRKNFLASSLCLMASEYQISAMWYDKLKRNSNNYIQYNEMDFTIFGSLVFCLRIVMRSIVIFYFLNLAHLKNWIMQLENNF